MKNVRFLKTIATLFAIGCALGATAQNVSYPFPDTGELVIEEPAGESAWHSRNSTKYMHLLGPLEYGGESSVPSKIISGNDGIVYIGNMFTDFQGSGWLKGVHDTETGSITLEFPQIIFDETYNDGKHYYYYACCMQFNEDASDLEVAESQTLVLTCDNNGNYMPLDQEAAVGICYVSDPVTDDQPAEAGYDGCVLKWFGIAYADMEWVCVDADPAVIPERSETQRYALSHSSGARFVDIAENNGKIYIAGLAEDSEVCIVGDINTDDCTVTFASNQFLGVEKSGDYFCYMVAAAPDDILDPDTGETLNTIAPADAFVASLDPVSKRMTFTSALTGFSITNGQSKVGGGDLYIEPRLTPQAEYVANSPDKPEIVQYSPYNEIQGYGTFNFNIPFWTNEGLLINPANMFYNIYLDDEKMTLSPDCYVELDEELTDIPYGLTDGYDIFSVGINHAIYLYSGNYSRIGVQSFVIDDDGNKYLSTIVYNDSAGLEGIEEEPKTVVETYFIDLSGKRIRHFETGFAIKCTRYEDGSIKTEKIIR